MLLTMLAALPRPLAFVLRHLMLGVPLAAVIALFFSIAFQDRYDINFVYSLCIGLICQVTIDLGRLGAARLMGRKSWPGWPVALVVIVFAVWLGINGGYALAGWLLDRPLPAPGLRDGRSLFIIVAISLVASTGLRWTM